MELDHILHPNRRFVGKTIAKIDTKACNVWRFEFTDGSKIAIEVDYVGSGLYGMVGCVPCGERK